MFEIDDVLQLQCTGEVENINAISSQVPELTIAFLLTIKVNYKASILINK